MSRNYPIRSFIVLITAALLCAASVQAGKNKDKSGFDADVDVGLSATITAGISFGDARRLATDYKLTGSKPLPPGIRKNMARGKPMPPGIAKTRMPNTFINQLPHHEGHEWLHIGANLVLVVAGTLIISDILKGVFD